MSNPLTKNRIDQCYDIVRSALLDERVDEGHWVGELSTSALSTATAVMALEMVRRDGHDEHELAALIAGGLSWLVEHQNNDGGWGDTVKSLSNISTSMLVHATFVAAGQADRNRSTLDAAIRYIDQSGGVPAVVARYGKDKTFSVPILMHCALAGLVDWRDVSPLPFELACLPHRFYKTVQLPVVSYALPALIAIGQVRHHHRKPRNPISLLLRTLARRPSLKVLQRIQPSNGGFLEAPPLTSFVTMSLAGMGLSNHPVVRRGLEFLIESVLPDGSWPIDTNLATWVTTLSLNALKDDLPETQKSAAREWLLEQQYREVHPFTHTDPGGWAWTNLPGAVPDADDSPGAILALLNLRDTSNPDDIPAAERQALQAGVNWLLDLQNRDGGWPTFCRGWGTLPFDRSAPDISAHVLRAMIAWRVHPAAREIEAGFLRRVEVTIGNGFAFLERTQRPDGSWLPLWFGNQFATREENPTYGTARVLAAFRDAGRLETPPAQRGLKWLENAQNDDGGWGGEPGITSSIEETALATELLISTTPRTSSAQRGLLWLIERIEQGTFAETTPIGFYFAKLWYFERLYPLTFIVGALAAARRSAHALIDPNNSQRTQPDLRKSAVTG